MTKYRLYLTDHGPNGCNTLLVVDIDSQLVDAYEDATFGVQMPRNMLCNSVLICGEFLAAAPDSRDEIQPDAELCTDVDLDIVIRRRACNPIDPNGDRLLKFLTKYGFETDGAK